MTMFISPRRRDGKWPVTHVFAGAPNAFGGYYPSKRFGKLYTPEQLHEAVQKHGDEQQRAHYTPLRCGFVAATVQASEPAFPAA